MDVLVAVRIVAGVRVPRYAAKWRSPLKGDGDAASTRPAIRQPGDLLRQPVGMSGNEIGREVRRRFVAVNVVLYARRPAARDGTSLDAVFAQELKLSDKWGLQTALLVCPAACAVGALLLWMGSRARRSTEAARDGEALLPHVPHQRDALGEVIR